MSAGKGPQAAAFCLSVVLYRGRVSKPHCYQTSTAKRRYDGPVDTVIDFSYPPEMRVPPSKGRWIYDEPARFYDVKNCTIVHDTAVMFQQTRYM